ncbi:MAG TPA: galactokinase [Chloroflexia bacterium]|nr:galactokinase [Chloroflexia bacterium]
MSNGETTPTHESEQDRIATLKQDFEAHFGEAPDFVSRAPGRVNLIGEHTDYNGGFVLPVAINRTVLMAVKAGGTQPGEIVISSREYHQDASFNLNNIEKAPEDLRWTNYLRGVAWALQERGLLDLAKINGARLMIESNVPQGAGLSSSAALEVATGLTLFNLAGIGPQQVDRPKMALACQLAENGFVGANTGIMDQFVSALGQRDSALLIDTRTLEYRAVPLGFAARGLKLVAVNSAVPHRHDASGYNQRRAECEEAARFLANTYQMSEDSQLRDFNYDQLAAVFTQMPELPAKRARHVITEDQRTLKAVELMENGFANPGDLERFGELLRQSHESMRDDFQITVPEVDLLVELAWALPGVIGARMTGGGFGGCTVNVVREVALEAFRLNVFEEYRKRTGLDAKMYIFDAVEGGSIPA